VHVALSIDIDEVHVMYRNWSKYKSLPTNELLVGIMYMKLMNIRCIHMMLSQC